MKLVKCPNNHYYDGDKYTTCPVCSGTVVQESGDETVPLNPGTSAGDQTLPLTPPEPAKPVETKPNFSDLGNILGTTETTRMPTGDETIPLHFDKTAPINSKGYIVGWLVGLRGENKGLSFSLYPGQNFIGRDKSNDVVLTKDRTVSREKHGNIVYEPRAKMFIAAPGHARELYYLNNNVVLSQMELKPYDVISLGKTDLLFVPLVGENFSWSDYEEAEK